MNKTRTCYFLFVMLILTCGTLAFGQVTPCVIRTNNPGGICGPYYYPLVTGSNGSNVNVQMGFWNSANAPAGSSQTMYTFSPGDWYVDANFPNGNTAIETYPNSDAIYFSYSPEPEVSSFAYMFSSFAEDMHLNPNTDAEAAYDIWLNSYSNEVMIWNDISNRGGPGYCGGCTSKLSAQAVFGGAHGVPKHLWDLAKCGSELVWRLDQPALSLCAVHGPGAPHDSVDVGTGSVYGITKGSVDVCAMLMWLETNGYLPSDSTLTQLEYGFEIASTGGVNERFQVTGWSVTSSQP